MSEVEVEIEASRRVSATDVVNYRGRRSAPVQVAIERTIEDLRLIEPGAFTLDALLADLLGYSAVEVTVTVRKIPIAKREGEST